MAAEAGDQLQAENIFKTIGSIGELGIIAVMNANPELIEDVDEFGNTPLLKGCTLGMPGVTNFLISRRANMHVINYFGQNALTCAVYSGNIDIVLALLSVRSYDDFTMSSIIPPLCVAMFTCNKQLTDLFWTMDPHPRLITTCHGDTAYQFLKKCNPDFVKNVIRDHPEAAE